MAGCGTCYFCSVETGTGDLGINPVWGALHYVCLCAPEPVYAGDLQDAAVCGDNPCADYLQLEEEKRGSAARKSGPALFPGRAIVKTTRLAGGLFCPYKGLLPACARKAH